MMLLLDAGNTRVKWIAVGLDGQVAARGFLQKKASAQDWRALAAQLPGRPAAVHAGVVAGADIEGLLSARVRECFDLPVNFLRASAEWQGLRNGYFEPSRLGVDRWLAMVGARVVTTGALLVVDAGTALTVDAVTKDGLHLGGYIVPGYSTQQRALGMQTADVGTVQARNPDGALGRQTSDAVANGIALALAALVNRAQVELHSRVVDTCSVVLTGGDADVIAPLLHGSVLKDDDLLFRGLWAVVMPGGLLHCPTPTGQET